MKTIGSSVPLSIVSITDNFLKCSVRHWIAHSVHELNTWLPTAAGSSLQGLRTDSSPHHPARHHGCYKQLCSCFSDGDGARDPPRSHTSWTHPQTCRYSRLCGVSTTFLVTFSDNMLLLFRHPGQEGSGLASQICMLHVHIRQANEWMVWRFSKLLLIKDSVPDCV